MIAEIRFKSPLKPSQSRAVLTPKAISDLFMTSAHYKLHSLP